MKQKGLYYLNRKIIEITQYEKQERKTKELRENRTKEQRLKI